MDCARLTARESLGTHWPRRLAGPAAIWWFGLALYFCAQVVARLWASEALELDEAEQVLWTQQLALGYGTQPPLYTWLQWGMFQLTGASVLGLTLLKNGLLAALYGFTFLAARTVLPLGWSAIAAAAMLLLPPIGWEAQRDLTHSVLCTTAAAALLWLVMAALRRPRGWHYLGMGVAVAAGVLGKYSFVLFAGSLALALLLSPQTRPLLRPRGLLATAVVATLLVAPHGLWLVEHLQQASDGTLAKLQAGDTAAWPHDVPAALLSLLHALSGFAGLALLVFAAVGLGVRRGRQPSAPAMPDSVARAVAAGLLTRQVLLAVLALAAMALAGAGHSFKARWLMPLLFTLPMAIVLGLPRFTTEARARALAVPLLVLALLLPLMIALRPLHDASRHRPDELNVPARELAAALRAAGWSGGTLVADDAPLAASLRLQGVAAPALSLGDPLDGLASGDRRLPTLWVSSQAADAADRARWVAAARAAGCATPPPVIALPYRHAASGEPPLRWDWCIVPAH